MNKLKNERRQMITDQNQILQMQAVYYQDLYTDKVEKSFPEIEQYISNTEVPQLENNQKLLCEGNLTESECLKALNSMKCKKTPGNDGLTAEFYKKFWNIINVFLLNQ